MDMLLSYAGTLMADGHGAYKKGQARNCSCLMSTPGNSTRNRTDGRWVWSRWVRASRMVGEFVRPRHKRSLHLAEPPGSCARPAPGSTRETRTPHAPDDRGRPRSRPHRWQAGEASKERLKLILDEVSANASWPAGSPEQLSGDFYAACMDEARIEKDGLAPLRPTLAEIDALAEMAGVQRTIERFHDMGLRVPFGIVFALEKRLAEASLDNVALRDPRATDHLTTFAALGGLASPPGRATSVGTCCARPPPRSPQPSSTSTSPSSASTSWASRKRSRGRCAARRWPTRSWARR
jgi:hypothetical protein